MDIQSRKDIERLIKSFYEKVVKDETIGFIFTDIAKVNWEKHLPVMYDFWETLLLDAASYRQNAMEVHYRLNRVYPFEEKHFQRWLQLFSETVDELFTGEKAMLAKKKARSIAGLMQFKMQQEKSGIRITNNPDESPQYYSQMIKWLVRSFADLNTHELYAILRLRSEVFVVEQDCVFQDMDNRDQHCHHLMGWENDILVAYTRLVPPGISYAEASIGRVVTSPAARGSGAGRLLIQKSIEAIETLYGRGAIQIGAQLYLKKFYESFAFRQEGEIYDEDGIDHIHMIRR